MCKSPLLYCEKNLEGSPRDSSGWFTNSAGPGTMENWSGAVVLPGCRLICSSASMALAVELGCSLWGAVVTPQAGHPLADVPCWQPVMFLDSPGCSQRQSAAQRGRPSAARGMQKQWTFHCLRPEPVSCA